MTINEPFSFCFLGYHIGPGLSSTAQPKPHHSNEYSSNMPAPDTSLASKGVEVVGSSISRKNNALLFDGRR